MSVTRRTFLETATAAATSASVVSAQPKKIPLGLELYSVRSALSADPIGTVKKVAAMGYQVVEFFSPYYAWTTDQAKEMKKLLDDLGIQCRSTHNNMMPGFLPANLQKETGVANEGHPQFPIGNQLWLVGFAGARGDCGVAHQAAELPGTLAKRRIVKRVF